MIISPVKRTINVWPCSYGGMHEHRSSHDAMLCIAKQVQETSRWREIRSIYKKFGLCDGDGRCQTEWMRKVAIAANKVFGEIDYSTTGMLMGMQRSQAAYEAKLVYASAWMTANDGIGTSREFWKQQTLLSFRKEYRRGNFAAAYIMADRRFWKQQIHRISYQQPVEIKAARAFMGIGT